MSAVIGTNKRAKRVYNEVNRLLSSKDPQDVSKLLSQYHGEYTHVPGLEQLIRSKIRDYNFGKDGSRKRLHDDLMPNTARGKKFRKLRKTHRRKQKRRHMTRRR
jgi:hypothetical protein